MSTKLKPCPLCGHRAEIDSSEDFGIVCTNEDECGVKIFDFVSEQAAIKAWNRRVGEKKA